MSLAASVTKSAPNHLAIHAGGHYRPVCQIMASTSRVRTQGGVGAAAVPALPGLTPSVLGRLVIAQAGPPTSMAQFSDGTRGGSSLSSSLVVRGKSVFLTVVGVPHTHGHRACPRWQVGAASYSFCLELEYSHLATIVRLAIISSPAPPRPQPPSPPPSPAPFIRHRYHHIQLPASPPSLPTCHLDRVSFSSLYPTAVILALAQFSWISGIPVDWPHSSPRLPASIHFLSLRFTEL